MVVICKYCNKEYASYASRSNHIKKFHSNDSNVDVKNMSNKTSKDTVLQVSINKERTYYILNEYTRYIINRRKYYYHPVLYGIIPNGLKYRSSKCTSKLLGERIESLYSKGTKIVVPKTLEEWGRNMGLFEELCRSTRII